MVICLIITLSIMQQSKFSCIHVCVAAGQKCVIYTYQSGCPVNQNPASRENIAKNEQNFSAGAFHRHLPYITTVCTSDTKCDQ